LPSPNSLKNFLFHCRANRDGGTDLSTLMLEKIMSNHLPQKQPIFLLGEINSEITEIQRKLLELQSRLFEAKQSIIERDFQNSLPVVPSELSEETPIPF
jgi:hypothetical protein